MRSSDDVVAFEACCSVVEEQGCGIGVIQLRPGQRCKANLSKYAEMMARVR